MGGNRVRIAGMLVGLVVLPLLNAQEVVTPLFNNRLLAAERAKPHHVKKSVQADTLDLPFFDDFSTSYIFPDETLWSDAFAFVNNSFPVEPRTNGVATLDALDDDGSIYTRAVLSPSTFVADHLTSRPIRLSYPASDSIYLSFLYQPGGLCEAPDDKDSLMVDFFAPDSGQWVNVWRIPGTELHPFKQVMIPVTQERYLADGFRFRFRNRASLFKSDDFKDKRSNADYWHVDYVRLDRNRFSGDTVLRDVAFTTPLTSILKDLTSLPWSHFESAKNTVLQPFLSARYMNNDSISRNVTRSLSIEEPWYGESYVPGTPTAQDLPSREDTVVEYSYVYPFNFNRGDSALIRFKAALRTDENDPKVNDTVIHDLILSDYYAYDDGTPEAGYGLRGSGTESGLVALKYHSFLPDEIGGVDIYFNQVYDSLNLDYYFNLVIWEEKDGMPGSIIWEDETDFRPRYSSTYTGFTRYRFTQPVHVNGDFFIGWRQFNKYLLNVGLDLNDLPVPPVLYYNWQGDWQPSAAPGVMMFRPFVYREPLSNASGAEATERIRVYPNPASGSLHILIDEQPLSGDVPVQVYDGTGRLVLQQKIRDNRLDLNGLPEGLYILQIVERGHRLHTRFLIQR